MKHTLPDEEFAEKLSALMLSEGVANLTVAEIAARMRCSRRRLYELAGSKEELFFLFVQQLFDAVLQKSLEIVKTERDLATAISAYLDLGVRAAGKMSAVSLADLQSSVQGRKLYQDYQRTRAKWLGELIDEGVKRGVFARYHSRVVTEIILAALLNIRRPKFLEDTNITMEEAVDELYKLILNGLLLKQPSPARANRAPTQA
jgi:AcrR family transcriptional regulator